MRFGWFQNCADPSSYAKNPSSVTITATTGTFGPFTTPARVASGGATWHGATPGYRTLSVGERVVITAYVAAGTSGEFWLNLSLAIGNPTPTGARVVVLDAATVPLSIAEADLGLPWNWRVGPGNAAPSDAIMHALTFTPAGRGLKPFAPAQARMRRLANGDLDLRWIRRDRALAADSWVLTDAPMSEATESYDLEILSGATVKRTLTVAAPTALYTAAMQTADFGGPIASLSVRIHQIGALGRGVPLATTLTVTEAL